MGFSFANIDTDRMLRVMEAVQYLLLLPALIKEKIVQIGVKIKPKEQGDTPKNDPLIYNYIVCYSNQYYCY